MSSPAPQPRPRPTQGALPRLAGAGLERARLTVVPGTRPQITRAPFAALVTLLLLGGVVGLLLFNTSLQQNSFTTAALEAQAKSLSARQQTLQMELEELRNSQRVAREARELGMVRAAAPTFLRLSDGAVVGAAPKPATADSDVRIEARPPQKPSVYNPPPTVIEVPATDVPTSGAAAGDAAAAGSAEELPTDDDPVRGERDRKKQKFRSDTGPR
ncbi:FtsB/FtsL family cell division protein [Nocardioides pacificus]